MVKIVSNVSPNSLLQSNGASPIKPSGVIAAADTITTGIWNAGSVTSSSFITAVGNLRGLALGINTAPQANAGTIQLLPTANGVDVIVANRATDSSPTGDFLNFLNAANNASLFKLDVTGTITTGIWNAGALTTSGALALTTAASKIVPGATSLSLRNTADSADNLLITNAGDVTVRGNLVVSGIGPHAIGGAVNTIAQLLLTGSYSSGTNQVEGFRIASTLLPAAGSDALLMRNTGSITKAGSGTHGDFVGYSLDAFGINAGAATVLNATTLKITGAPTGATNNYALWVVAGQARLGTDVRFGTRTAIGAETVTGFITITDDGGTSRKLAVVS